jgi:hypothetical protein
MGEREQEFGQEFITTVQRIIATNDLRRSGRLELTLRHARDPHDELVPVDSSIDSFLDRLAIRIVQGGVSLVEAREKLQPWFLQLESAGLEDTVWSESFARLILLHEQMTRTWADLRTAVGRLPSGRSSFVAAGRSIYLLNDSRTDIRRLLREGRACLFWDVKEYVTYPFPLEWCATHFAWRNVCGAH